LSKIVQNSEESQVFLHEKSVSKKGFWKFNVGSELLSSSYWLQNFTLMVQRTLTFLILS